MMFKILSGGDKYPDYNYNNEKMLPSFFKGVMVQKSILVKNLTWSICLNNTPLGLLGFQNHEFHQKAPA